MGSSEKGDEEKKKSMSKLLLTKVVLENHWIKIGMLSSRNLMNDLKMEIQQFSVHQDSSKKCEKMFT